MNKAVFDKIREIIYEQGGIRISDGKATMVASRLRRRLGALGLADEHAYLAHLQKSMDTEIVHLLDVISTNVTHFFREAEHLDHLRALFVAALGEGQTRFRFWSAGCSTGQEPYSIAMTLLEAAGSRFGRLDVKILATDLSTNVLAKASEGAYPAKDADGIPTPLRARYFDVATVDGEKVYRVKPQMRELVKFARLNFAKPPFPMRGPMDVIFCRNVMIYFDDVMRNRLVAEFARLLKPSGDLVIGLSESLTKTANGLERIGASIYRKPAAIPAPTGAR